MKYGINICSSAGLREDLPGSPGLCMLTCKQMRLSLYRQGDRRDKLEQQPVGMKCVATGAMLSLWRGSVFVYFSVLCPTELPPWSSVLMCLHSSNEEAVVSLKPCPHIRPKLFLRLCNRKWVHLNVQWTQEEKRHPNFWFPEDFIGFRFLNCCHFCPWQ